ncbi:MAG TPA: PadR family transcriptional regulator [Chloroflexota bacterium]|nr:PadR family transcriptional regulator [Chloroflexota bacterium]
MLGLLRERDMHPYEMQRQLRLRHTDDLLVLKRGSLYHAINQLQRDGLIEPVETSREGRWPERTVYRITAHGDEVMIDWLRDLLSTPQREPSQFMAALAHVLQLTPRDALAQLQVRLVNLGATIASLHAVEHGIGELVGRASILEVEYASALLQAERAWLGRVVSDLQSGKLDWDFKKKR